MIGGREYRSNRPEVVVKKTRTVPNVNLPPAVQNLSPFAQQRPMASYSDYILKDGDNIVEKINKNMHMRLEADKTTCYVGEPVTASYKLYTRLKSESKLTQNPSFNGFSVIDLQQPDITPTARQKLSGKEYNVYTLRKAQLYPLQAGNIALESAELENNVQFIRDNYAKKNVNGFSNLFDDFSNAMVPPEAVINQTVYLKSKPVNIVVKPLPEAGKPVSFKGSVGKFK
jgi:hypothetical protein